jgi:dGTPase
MTALRTERQSGTALRADDSRGPFQVDRDRILYSLAFRRLAGVTQVVSPGEGEIFHNRLTHSIKVAQIARRFAENLGARYPDVVNAWGGLDPEVAEAAALAHDLGHPPFGHAAEAELDLLISAELAGATRPDQTGIPGQSSKTDPQNAVEGYEGNAQSFRVVTELAVRRPESTHGLDLTRATLNAVLKYPWHSGENPRLPTKCGAYRCDSAAFRFAREGARPAGQSPRFVRSLEAQIMDWADDVAYSVHDTEDFYRAGLIPLDRLAGSVLERERFLEVAAAQAERAGIAVNSDFQLIFTGLFNRVRVREPYAGAQEQQQLLYDFVSSNIHRFVSATRLREPPGSDGEAVSIPDDVGIEVFLLKQLLRMYVIENPALAAHRLGQRRAIRTLFQEFHSAAAERRWQLFPAHHRDRARKIFEDRRLAGEIPVSDRIRLVADTVASMTDRQALLVYQRFTGVSLTSVFDPLVR